MVRPKKPSSVPDGAWWLGKRDRPIKDTFNRLKDARAEAKKRGPGRHTIDGYVFYVSPTGMVYARGKI